MNIAEFVRQIADAYDPNDEIETFMIKAGVDPHPIFWPPRRHHDGEGWVSILRPPGDEG